MPSPFAGMDPYLEDAVLWPSFQHDLISGISLFLLPGLPPQYIARFGERRYCAGDERCEKYIEIIDRGDGRLVTHVDMFSPSNKTSAVGRDAYLNSRRQAVESGANLVEIDLVLQGHSLLDYSRDGLPQWDYDVTVTRAAKPVKHEIYTATLQKRLPRFCLPLGSTDRHIVMDLQKVFGRCYEVGDFAGRINYNRAPAGLHERIAIAAYHLWQQEGYPHGRDREHWYKAMAQLRKPTSAA